MPSTPAYAFRKDHSLPAGSDLIRILNSPEAATEIFASARASPLMTPNTPAQTPKTTTQNCVLIARLSTIPPRLTLTQPSRTSMFALMTNPNASFSRRLSLLLVLFILYGTTVEAAHRHGRSIARSASSTSQFNNEPDQNLTNNKTGCNDCLICQLHQNLTTTLIALRLNDPPAQLPHCVTPAVQQDLLAQIISPLAGRAPPRAI